MKRLTNEIKEALTDVSHVEERKCSAVLRLWLIESYASALVKKK